MARSIRVTSYLARIATCSQGFNEWRKNITLATEDAATNCDIRFVDDPSNLPPDWEKVNENGWSTVYLPSAEFSGVLELLRTEQPLYLVLYPDSKRAMIETGQEPPGEAEKASVQP